MKKLLLISLLFVLFVNLGFAAQKAKTIRFSGAAVLPEKCPAGAEATLTVKLTWQDVPVNERGTGKKIVEEAVFTGKEGQNEIEFVEVHITPESTDGLISIDALCEIKQSGKITKVYVLDENAKENSGICTVDGAFVLSKCRLKLVLKEK